MYGMADRSPTITGLVESTPAQRNRYVDFIRVFAIGVVVVGHWLLALTILNGDGGISHMLGVQLLTWGLQVMPLFFFVGGFAHGRTLASLHRRGGTYGEFLRSRSSRLLPPILVFLVVWLVAAAVLETAGWENGPIETATDRVTTPLWFIGVYLLLVLAAPAMYDWHRRHGGWVVVVLAVAAICVDLVRYGMGWSWVAAFNLFLVWAAVHQLGYLWSDGLLDRPGLPALAAAGGLGVTALLTLGTGWYPVLMVGLPSEPVSNMAPPNVALLTHGIGLIGLALLFRAPVERWLRQPRPWGAVILGNSVIMTLFCWHLTAVYLVQGALLLFGLRPPPAGTARWLAFLPLWVLLCAVPLVLLVRLFRYPEQASARTKDTQPVGQRRRLAAVAGLTLAALGIFVVSQVGLDGMLSGRTEQVLVFHLPAWLAILAIGAGTLLLRLRAPREAPAVPS
ncbi:hypothetical protein GCM10022251_38050 [Phytohabitans flavus]